MTAKIWRAITLHVMDIFSCYGSHLKAHHFILISRSILTYELVNKLFRLYHKTFLIALTFPIKTNVFLTYEKQVNFIKYHFSMNIILLAGQCTHGKIQRNGDKHAMYCMYVLPKIFSLGTYMLHADLCD